MVPRAHCQETTADRFDSLENVNLKHTPMIDAFLRRINPNLPKGGLQKTAVGPSGHWSTFRATSLDRLPARKGSRYSIGGRKNLTRARLVPGSFPTHSS